MLLNVLVVVYCEVLFEALLKKLEDFLKESLEELLSESLEIHYKHNSRGSIHRSTAQTFMVFHPDGNRHCAYDHQWIWSLLDTPESITIWALKGHFQNFSQLDRSTAQIL